MPDYSRPFKFTQPADQFAPSDNENLFKTSFLPAKVREILARNPNADWAKVETFTHIPSNKECFKMTLFEGTVPGEVILGDFPCPNQCIPPRMEIADRYCNSFDRGSVESVVNQSNCAYLTIRFSKLNTAVGGGDTVSMYGVVAFMGTLAERLSAGNQVYISTHIS